MQQLGGRHHGVLDLETTHIGIKCALLNGMFDG